MNKYYLNNWVNLSFYLNSPRDTAALLNSEDPLGNNTFRMRGTNWSFVRYLLDRFGNPATEWQLTRQLITDGASNARDAVENVFGVSYDRLASDWSAMLIVEDRADLGGPAGAELQTTSYRMRDIYENVNAPPFLGGGYPLTPLLRFMNQSSTVPMDLFTATSSYVTLSAAAASGGTGLRLMGPAGADLSAAIMPYMAIVRTK